MKKVVTPRLRIHVNALWPFSAALPDGTALYIIHSALVFEKNLVLLNQMEMLTIPVFNIGLRPQRP